MRALPENEIREALKHLPARSFRNEAFHRNVTSAIATTYRVLPLDTGHAMQDGGRYNFKGSFPVAYLSHNATLAAFEIEKRRRVIHLPSPSRVDLDACRLDITILVTGPFLDLTDRTVIDALPGVTSDLLTMPTSEWQRLQSTRQEATTQVIGRLAHSSKRFGGIYFPAAEAKFLKKAFSNPNNLAVFMNSKDPTRPEHPAVHLKIHDPNHFLADLGLHPVAPAPRTRRRSPRRSSRF